MRKGVITSIITTAGCGYLVDENDQEIQFCLRNLRGQLSVGDVVWFEIDLTNHGLTAINIRLGAK